MHFLTVQRGSAVSSSEPVIVLDAEPGVFTRDSSGSGDGVISATRNKTTFRPTPSSPAMAGDVLTVFCAGLGEVQTPVKAGAPPPSVGTDMTANSVTATLGGIKAPVSFAGLAPGFAGLYQVNLTVPKGVNGDHVPLVLTVDAQSSPPVTVAIR